jgi:hypothetical protein
MKSYFTSAKCPMMKGNIHKTFMILLSVFFITTLGSKYCFADSIALQWDPSPSKKVVGYKVHSRTEGGGYYLVEDVGNATKYVVRGLSSDERYIFSVTAYDATGTESIHSNAVRWGAWSTDIGPSETGGGCLIATVAHGTPHAKDALFLRQFRDRHLEPYALGRWIISVYEWISPSLVDMARRSEVFRSMIRGVLGTVVYILKHLLRSVIVFFTLAAGLIIGFIFYKRWKKTKPQSADSRG